MKERENMKKIEKVQKLRIEKIPVEKMTPAPYNPRMISDEARSGLKESMDLFGYVEPIVWNERTGHIVSGHQRFRCLVEDGTRKEIEVVVLSIDEAQEKLLNITLNNEKIAGEWDFPKLLSLSCEIREDFFSEMDALRIETLVFSASSFFEDKEKANEVDKEYIGMPECRNEDLKPGEFRRITLVFAEEKDVHSFEKKIGRKIGPKEKFLYFPEREKLEEKNNFYGGMEKR